MVTSVGDLLREAQQQGFLGPTEIDEQVEHSRAFAAVLQEESGAQAPGPWIDLGPGGGLPGLVVADTYPEHHLVLVEGSVRRAAFLEEAVGRLGWSDRVEVVAERAELAGRRPELRGAASAVLARSFGPPPVVAECAAPLLSVGGMAIVSEPPGGPHVERWSPSGLDALGMRARRWVSGPPSFVVLEQVTPCPARFPRRTGVPTKRPLW